MNLEIVLVGGLLTIVGLLTLGIIVDRNADKIERFILKTFNNQDSSNQ